ncbi:RNA polymerase factor sigma-54 [Helicobacter sp. MIT 21-1697]|uniref:RNA polymerase factor sigma-54 n=1 Tax=Helicobacter sp. MIT 21-1697 TaxID=2993733 RepID=UPI00224A9EBC|nr:RNA polymerase factor sigma-54 [Helicobacter sp. MIT 21-1697]MCX2717726.1 RNA polymerase factor sigma-54 [Helicobacter sp. MIT 21-1697]
MSVGGKLRSNLNIKTRLSTTLKSWLPILQSGVMELEETLNAIVEENPYACVQSQMTQSLQSKNYKKSHLSSNTSNDRFESIHISQKSLYEVLEEQIDSTLFPTEISRTIAFKIVENLNEDGYLDTAVGEIAYELGLSEEDVERVRQRFAYLEPYGVGAKDVIESFLFQLSNTELEGESYDLAARVIRDLHNHSKYKNHPAYNEVMKTIKSFRNPPAIEFGAKEAEVIPDIFIFERVKTDTLKNTTYELEVSINDVYYPKIIIEEKIKGVEAHKESAEFLKTKLKEAKDLVDALDMRKATILKIAIALRENQYDFFMGGEIRPMKLKDIAQDLGYAPSTISRAIANKYLECDRGIFPIKSFFTAAIDGDTSNASIKDFILNLVKNEDRKKPLSDLKILKSVEQKFDLKMVRRTITKYRQQLNIASSSERKKLYEISV